MALGSTSIVGNTINTGDVKPIRLKPICLPQIMQEKYDQLKKIFLDGSIEPSASP